MDQNIYQPPASSGQEVGARRSAAKYLALAGALTFVAVVLCEASLARVRLLLPEYPSWITIGIYRPPEVVRFFHSVGSTGLIVLLLTASVAAAVVRKISIPPALLRIGAVTHLAFLSLAVLAYAFCLWQISRVLAQLP